MRKVRQRVGSVTTTKHKGEGVLLLVATSVLGFERRKLRAKITHPSSTPPSLRPLVRPAPAQHPPPHPSSPPDSSFLPLPLPPLRRLLASLASSRSTFDPCERGCRCRLPSCDWTMKGRWRRTRTPSSASSRPSRLSSTLWTAGRWAWERGRRVERGREVMDLSLESRGDEAGQERSSTAAAVVAGLGSVQRRVGDRECEVVRPTCQKTGEIQPACSER